MIITFLGTRGYIDVRTRRHYRHTSTLIEYKNMRVMIDCGLDWSKKVWDIKPDAIIITHGHPDHAWGLKNGSPCPVYATHDSWLIMEKFAIEPKFRNLVYPRNKFSLGAIIFEAFDLIHSIRAPAVGYRIHAGQAIIFCAHDIISIIDRHEALHNALLYIGDGASLVRPIIRRKDDKLFGHAAMSTQMGWCEKEHVPCAIFTHCGSQIVQADGRKLNARLHKLAKKHMIKARIAYDGLIINVLL